MPAGAAEIRPAPGGAVADVHRPVRRGNEPANHDRHRRRDRVRPGAYRRRLNGYLIVAGVLIALCLVVAMTDKPFAKVQDFYESLFAEGYGDDRRSVDVRIEGLQFYFGEFVRTNCVGFGWISSSRSASENPIMAAINTDHMFLTDLGFPMVLFMYGVPGCLLLIAVVGKMTKDCRQLLSEGDGPRNRWGLPSCSLAYRVVSCNYFFYFNPFTLFYAVPNPDIVASCADKGETNGTGKNDLAPFAHGGVVRCE